MSLAEQVGGVRYRAWIASLGRSAKSFLRCRQLGALLLGIFGRRYVLSEHRSCLTRYGEGDHLGPHLDEPAAECRVTVIVYLAVTRACRRSARTGLQMRIYGRKPTLDRKPRLILPTNTGDVVVGRGSLFWHERPELRKGEGVLALTACYRPG